ncbi:MAG: hypothetical protein JO314_04005 [Acidobacteria bacterium]|nr:hypothetical protein [Acidobacteriota bacterium]
MELDPVSIPVQADLGRAYLLARRYDEAYPYLKGAHDRMLGGHMGDIDAYFGILLEQMKRTEELQQLAPYGPDVMQALNRGYPAYWRAIIVSIERDKDLRPQQAWKASFLRALTLAKLGEKDRAIEGLSQAYKAHDDGMDLLPIDPAFDNLRSDPRFQELVRRLNFPE